MLQIKNNINITSCTFPSISSFWFANFPHGSGASIFLDPMDSAFKRRTTDMEMPKLTDSWITWSLAPKS